MRCFPLCLVVCLCATLYPTSWVSAAPPRLPPSQAVFSVDFTFPTGVSQSRQVASHRRGAQPLLPLLGRQVKAQQAQGPDELVPVIAISATLGALTMIPIIGNLVAIAQPKQRLAWGLVGLFGAVYMAGMTFYIGGHGGFFERSKVYSKAMIPVWALCSGLTILSIINLATAPAKKSP